MDHHKAVVGSSSSPFTAPAHKNSYGLEAKIAERTIPNTEDTPPEPLQQTLFGELNNQNATQKSKTVALVSPENHKH